jgi:hypothetical protein
MARHKQVTTCRKTGGPLSDRCSCEHCTLSVCSVCGGFEGSLTTDCSRETLSFDRQTEIYETRLDYIESRGWHQGEPMQRRTPRFEGQPPHYMITSKLDPPPGHVVRIVGCECGWTVPDHEKNSSDFWDRHINAGKAKIAPAASTFMRVALTANASGAIGNLHTPTYAMASSTGLTRISGCACGWTVPAHEQNSDDAWSRHAALAKISPSTDWTASDRTIALKDALTQKEIDVVLAKRQERDADAVLTRIEDEADAYKNRDPDARAQELLQKLKWAEAAWKLADQRLSKLVDQRDQAAEKLVDELEKHRP